MFQRQRVSGSAGQWVNVQYSNLVNSDVNSTDQLLSPTREENNNRFVEICFLTCHEPPRCFILPISTRDKRRNSTSRSSHVISFSPFSCTASGQVQLDLVLDAVQQRWVEAVVAQVHRLHARCCKGSSHDRERIRADATVRDEQPRDLR